MCTQIFSKETPGVFRDTPGVSLAAILKTILEEKLLKYLEILLEFLLKKLEHNFEKKLQEYLKILLEFLFKIVL